jgi:ribokinase
MQVSHVVICGSINMDVVVQSERRPAAGETLLGAVVSFVPGGKGLNQAIASARLGTPTSLLGAVGDDSFGRTLRAFLADNDVDTLGLNVVRGQSSGVALIQVAEGNNAITVASGANHHFSREMVTIAPRDGEVWVGQFEIPVDVTATVLAEARQAGALTILNLAPFLPFPPALIEVVDVGVLNEIELSQATGTRLHSTSSEAAIAAACHSLRGRGARTVIATLGARGAVVVTAETAILIPGLQVAAVDTTGAGDCFVGALASRLAAGAELVDAARYATVAASCAVEKLGAAPSMPTAKDVAARLASA